MEKTMTQEEKVLAIIVADLHINHICALCPPTVNLDEGGTYHSTPSQRWLWECWLHFWKYIGSLSDNRKVIGFFNGDIGELDTKRRSNQLISPNKATIKSIISETLEPAVDVLDMAIFLRGTSAHEGKSSWLEESIADDCTITYPYSKNMKSWWHFRGKLSDVRFDIAHHGFIGGRPFNKANSVIRLATDTMWHYNDEMHQKPPDVVIRSHGHTFADSGENYPTRAFFTGGWSLINEFGYRTGHENDKTSIGGLVFDCIKDRYIWEKVDYQPKELRNIWKISL